MPWIDQTAARHLQALYLRCGRDEFLRGLYAECVEIARIRLVELARKERRALNGEMAGLAHQAASRLICRYRRPGGYRVTSFWQVLGNECRHAYYDGGHKERGKQRFLREQVPLDCALHLENGHELEQPGDPRDYRRDILSDHAVGWMIDKDLREARTFRAAIERIAGYVGRRWLYDHAVQLRYVYRVWKVKRGRGA